MKKLSLLIAALLLATRLPVTAADLLGVAEIRGIENLSAAVFDFTKAIGQPVPKEIVSLGIHGALGTMPGLGLEPNGTARILWFAQGDAYDNIAVLLPVAGNGNAYLKSLGDAGWATLDETDSGIQTYAAPSDSFLPFPSISFLRHNGKLLAAPSADTLEQAADLLPSIPSILPAEGVIAFQTYPAAILDTFSDSITAALNKAPLDNTPGADNARALADLYLNTYLAIARQIESTTDGIGVADGNLNLHSQFSPVPGSRLARWTDTFRPVAAPANAVNQPGALVVQVDNLGDLSLLADPISRLLDALEAIAPSDIPADTIALQRDTTLHTLRSMTGDTGFALFPSTSAHPIQIATYTAMNNTARLRDLRNQLLAAGQSALNNVLAEHANDAISVEFDIGEPRTYRDIPIDTLTLRIAVNNNDALSVLPIPNPLQLTQQTAWLDNAAVAAIGPEQRLHDMIDQLLDNSAQPVTALPAWQQFYPTPEPRLITAGNAAVFDSLRMAATKLDAITGDHTASSIPDSPGHISTLSYKIADNVMTRTKISLDSISLIFRKIQEAQEKARAQQEAQMRAFQELLESGDIQFSFDNLENIQVLDNTEYDDKGDGDTGADE